MIIDLKDIKTYYINLDKDRIRNKQVKAALTSLNIANVTRISGVNRPNDKAAGCGGSHHNILTDATIPVTVLEDDCLVMNNNTVIEVPDDADAVYLGVSSWGWYKGEHGIGKFKYTKHPTIDNIIKVEGMLATHAILYLNQDYLNVCNKIAKYSTENSYHIDVGFAEVQKFYNVYSLSNPIFYQSSNEYCTRISLDNGI